MNRNSFFPEEITIEHLRFFYQAILSVLPGHIYWKDREGRYLGCNQLQAEFHGLTRENIIGKTEFDLLPPEQAKTIIAIDESIMKNGETKTLEEKITLNGEPRIFLSKKVPLKMMRVTSWAY